ncbi:CPBP family intramembrane glutamic endopeptidase [Halomicrobium salinisoli]|uniref:CPBP family intramembrane glutamic endopeptidase n=1 Tax=Halomicrobium salinisoli TaxID=2878391 RepID=UPI001CF083BE|nr:type II CAAX endopeptidase family protein [Halomicrobium salinisoli]
MGTAEANSAPAQAVLEAIGLTLLAVLIGIVAGVVFVVPLIVLDYAIEARPVTVAGLVGTQLGFLIAGYLYSRYRDVPIPIERPSRSDLAYIGGGVGVALVAAITLSVALQWLDLLPGSVIEDMAATDPTLLLVLAVLSLVLVAPAEELLFRGAIQGRLRTVFGPVTAVAVASLVFGALHLTNYTGRVGPIVAGALLISVVGTVFGALYELTGSLTVPIVAHGVYNAILMSVSYVSVVSG